MKKVILFDLDGTLVDTLPDLAGALNYALRAVNKPEKTLKEVQSYVGDGVISLVRRALESEHPTDELLARALAEFRSYYEDHAVYLSRPYDGIFELISALKDKGYILGCVSNKYDKMANFIVNHYFPNDFSYTLGRIEGVPLKPAPDMLYIALEKLGVTKEEALFIGDSDVDYFTYHDMDMDGISCSYGFRAKNVLMELGAKFIADSPLQILEIIEKNFA